MTTLYLASVWVHILAASAWIGSIFFLMFVVVPWMRSSADGLGRVFLRQIGGRLRALGWICFAVLLVTGTFNLWVRGVRFASFADPEWRSSPFGSLVLAKLGIFAAIVAVSAVHDFVVGPRAVEELARDATSKRAVRLRRVATIMGRLSALLAVIVVWLAVMLVRGCA